MRGGFELNTSPLADWVGTTAADLAPLIDTLKRGGSRLAHCMAIIRRRRCHIGVRQDETGRFSVFVREERPHGGERPPAR